MCFPAESYLHSICIDKIQTLNQFNRMRVNANIELPLNFHFIIEGAPPHPAGSRNCFLALYCPQVADKTLTEETKLGVLRTARGGEWETSGQSVCTGKRGKTET